MILLTKKPTEETYIKRKSGNSLTNALKNKVKGVKDAIKRSDENYKNRKDDTNKYRSVLYWKDNKN